MTHKTHKKAYAAIAVALIIVTVVSLVIVYPEWFRLSKSLELGSISQITLDPQGGSVSSNNALTGIYWNLYCTVEASDVIQGFTLPSGQVAATSVQGINQEVQSTASVEVDIQPLQAYLIRDLTEQQVEYAPSAQGTTGSAVSAQSFQYYTWNEPTWRIFCNYEVTVKQNGNVIGTAVLNTQGNGAQAQQVQTNAGTIIITNMGGLMGNYLEPETPTQACILQPNNAYSGPSYIYDWGVIQQMVSDSFYAGSTPGSAATNYASYWYGNSRTSAGVAQDPVIVIGDGETNLYQPSQYGGWEGSDAGGSVKAVAPVMYSTSTLPSDKQTFLSLTEWLQNQGVDNFAAAPNSNGNNLGIYTMQFVQDTNGETALQLIVPWAAYEIPTVDIKIPVSMADTFVERPQVSDIKVNGYWQSNGEKTLLNIGAGATLEVGLTQDSTVTSSGLITVNCTDPRVQIIPTSQTVTMAPGATKTISFMVSQAGGSTSDGTAANPLSIVINSYDVDTGALEATDTVYCSLAATVGSNLTTTLNIHVQDNTAAHSPIVGEAVFLEWPPTNGQTTTAYTDSNGNIVETLSASAGGGYTGQVQITAEAIAQTASSPAYSAQALTYTVKAGPNSVTITMGATAKKTSSGIDWILIALIAGVIAAVITVIAVIAYAVKHPPRRRKR
jgi:hypothetical protein